MECISHNLSGIYLFLLTRYLVDLLSQPRLIRNVAVLGHLHHGKTSFMDMLISQCHELDWTLKKNERYLDVHDLERDRGLSIKAMPMTMALPNLKGKYFALNMIDTPGESFVWNIFIDLIYFLSN